MIIKLRVIEFRVFHESINFPDTRLNLEGNGAHPGHIFFLFFFSRTNKTSFSKFDLRS